MNASLEASISRLDFSALLDDAGRLLQVRTALPALGLLPEHLVSREWVSRPFELVLDCVSTSAHFELKSLIGEQMTVRLRQADGRYEPWHGYVMQAAQLGGDGGLARYRLTMGPWLNWLALRTDAFVFQGKTALEIVEEVFADYPAAQWRLAITDETASALRRRDVCVQYRESDLSFVSRLLAQEGLHWYFEHLDDEAAAKADASGSARHVLVIADAGVERTDLGPVRFAVRPPTAFESGIEDPIADFMAQRRLAPNAVATGSWDERQIAGLSAAAQSALELGEVPTLEIYDGAGARRFQDGDHADDCATIALGAVGLQAKRFEGAGGARLLRAGARFSLVDHFSYGPNTTSFDYPAASFAGHVRDDNAFTVLAVEHEASNNLGSQAARLLGRGALERGMYKNHFSCVLAAAQVIPRPGRMPTAPAALTARVVGIEGNVVTCGRGHEVKVQFHFQRGERPNAGGLPTRHGADRKGNAPGDERAGVWVRVASPAAGANWGSVYTPRIGSEVLVQFIDGDIDRPVIAGSVYDGNAVTPLAAGVDSGLNHPGLMSGLHSRRLDGGGFNQWALDDAPGQLRTRLHASHASAELGLGHLIQHSTNNAQRGAWRGVGFEAGTVGWVSVRAALGVLVTASPRAGTYGSAQGASMDAAEAVARLQAARELSRNLSQAARSIQAQGLGSHDDGQAVGAIVAALDAAQDGRYPGVVNGQPAMLAGEDGRSPGVHPVAAFAKPIVAFDTPSALLAAGTGSIASFSGQTTSLVAREDFHQAAAHTLTQASGGATSIYAHEGGLVAIAANGPVSVRAHTDELRLLAGQDVAIVSVNDEIRIQAKERIQLVAGQSALTLDGRDIEFRTPGTWAVQSATHAFETAATVRAAIPDLPCGVMSQTPDAQIKLEPVVPRRFSERFLVLDPLTGQRSSNLYRVALDDSVAAWGRMDGSGASSREVRGKAQSIVAVIGAAADWTIQYHEASPGLAPREIDAGSEGEL